MATYRQFQECVRLKYGYVPKTCWIAHVKADLGLVRRLAPNRADSEKRKYPCPPGRRNAILECMGRLSPQLS
jgi:hypothetical protein